MRLLIIGQNRVQKELFLARELSLEDIKEIRQKTPKELEIEAFVHGAMCISYSGRCLISQYLTGRDAKPWCMCSALPLEIQLS